MPRARCTARPTPVTVPLLAASVLVTNASGHAVGRYELRLRRTAAEIICEVLDHDPRMPELPGFPTTAPFPPAPQHHGGGLDALRPYWPNAGAACTPRLHGSGAVKNDLGL